MRSVCADGITDAVIALVRVLLPVTLGLLLPRVFFHYIRLAVEHFFFAACSSVMPVFKSACAACFPLQ
jgi:hypothetical protein